MVYLCESVSKVTTFGVVRGSILVGVVRLPRNLIIGCLCCQSALVTLIADYGGLVAPNEGGKIQIENAQLIERWQHSECLSWVYTVEEDPRVSRGWSKS